MRNTENHETNETMTHTEEIQENIKRLEYTISQNFWNKGYVANCQEDIKVYKSLLKL